MSELFDSIKTSILGSKSSDIDKQIDNSFRSIEKYSISSDRNKYIDMMKDLISKTGTSNSAENVVKSLQGSPQVQTYDQTGRISRYGEYEAIVRKISYCQRALDTLTDHIISPDDITKTSVQFLVDDNVIKNENSPVATTLARCKKINDKLKFDDKVRKIVRTTLHKGDNFIEIIPSPKGQHALSILHEGVQKTVDIISPNSIIKFSDNPITETIKYKAMVDGGHTKSGQSAVTIQLHGQLTLQMRKAYAA